MTLVVNPTGRTPAGLNLAIAATDERASIIVRTDGHANLPEDYVRCAVETLERTGAGNVGGMMIPVGTTAFEDAVARAMSTRIGIGAAPFHTGGAAGEADTVYLGVFRRDALAAVGGFDEFYVRAQDWELNYRIRAAGYRVFFDPRLRVEYRPRPNLTRLARQFHDSGIWRAQIVARRPDTASVRYLAAPMATAALGLSAVLAVVNGRSRNRVVFLASGLAPVGYLATVGAGALVAGRGLSPRARLCLPVAVATMHIAWGVGFLRGALRSSTAEIGRSAAARRRPSRHRA